MKQSYIAVLLLGLVIIVGLFLVVRGVFPGSQTAASGTAAGQQILIGAALCLTGDCAEWGDGELKSIQIALDEANEAGGIDGRKINLVVEDIQGTPQGAVNAMQKLVNVQHAEAILGLTWGDSFQAGYTVNNPAHIVSVAPSAALEALTLNGQPIDYVFSTWVPIKPEIQALQTYMRNHGVHHVVILHDKDPFGLMIANIFRAGASSQAIVIDKEFDFSVGYDDFRTTIVQLKRMNIDGIFVAFQSAVPKAKFLKQAHELGFAMKLFSTEDIQDDGLLKQFGPAMEGIVYVYPQASGEMDTFEKKFKLRYGAAPTGSSAFIKQKTAYEIIAALKDHYAHGTDLKTAIEKITIPGVFAKEIKFGDTHQLTGAQFQIKTVKNGQFIVIE